MRTKFFTWDKLLAAGIVLAALLLWIFFSVGKSGGNLAVEIDGAIVMNTPIERVEGQDLHFDGSMGDFVLAVRDGNVRVSETHCPDKWCMAQGNISGSGKGIICLPQRISVKIQAASDTVDIVAG